MISPLNYTSAADFAYFGTAIVAPAFSISQVRSQIRVQQFEKSPPTKFYQNRPNQSRNKLFPKGTINKRKDPITETNFNTLFSNPDFWKICEDVLFFGCATFSKHFPKNLHKEKKIENSVE